MEIAENDPNVVYITADSGEGGLDLLFKRNFPDRCFEFGISEQNAIGVAAGLALSGKRPFVYLPAPFALYRAFEFIRDDICLQNLPVTIIGVGSGISVSKLGPTHHSTEDYSLLSTLPRMTCLVPATPKQAHEAIHYAYKCNGPTYIRLENEAKYEFIDDDYRFDGNVDILSQGKNICFISAGTILSEVVEAARILNEAGKTSTIININMLKPLDTEGIAGNCIDTDVICVVEEHNEHGGLGSLVKETLFDRGIHKDLVHISFNDDFCKGYGDINEVRRKNKIDSSAIVDTILGLKN
ncbi:MAG: hypothetical protein J5537_07980 [Lachnospiraceae bacterium]|nr:hypothetical protein [Lachnospiraceae bacterium]